MSKRIGDFQSIPAELVTSENISQKSALFVDYHYTQSGKIDSVMISNNDEPGENILHKIIIKGTDGYISRVLAALMRSLEELKFIEDSTEAEMKQEMERVQKETGMPVIYTGIALSKENTPQKRLPEYDIIVRRSRYDAQDIFFIIKGIEKEDTATEPPFKVEVGRNGDFVFVSRKNIPLLVGELALISQFPS